MLVPAVFLCFSRSRIFVHRVARVCWLTVNSNCPKAKGSHFQTGSFIFPQKKKKGKMVPGPDP